MSYLIRMISPMNEWTQEKDEIINDSFISADAISDLRTTDNCISTWLAENNDEECIKKCVMALVSGFRTLDSMKVVLIDLDKIKNNGLCIKETEGNTKIEEYKNLHRDIYLLNAGKLQILARVILESIWEENILTFSKEKITQWMLQLIDKKLLEFDLLEKNMRVNFASSVNNLIKHKKISKDSIMPETFEKIQNQLLLNKRKTNCKFEMNCERYKK